MVEAVVEGLAGRIEADAEEAEAGERVTGRFLVVEDLRKRSSRCEAYLNGANQLGCVVGMDARCGDGVEAGEDAVQPRITVAFAASLKTGTELGLACRTGKKAFSERAKVETGSAGDDGKAAAGGDCMESGAGLAAVFARGEWLVGVGHVNQVVGQAGAFFRGWLGGAEVHSAIDGD